MVRMRSAGMWQHALDVAPGGVGNGDHAGGAQGSAAVALLMQRAAQIAARGNRRLLMSWMVTTYGCGIQ